MKFFNLLIDNYKYFKLTIEAYEKLLKENATLSYVVEIPETIKETYLSAKTMLYTFESVCNVIPLKFSPNLSASVSKFIDLYYFQGKSCMEVCDKMCISQSYFYGLKKSSTKELERSAQFFLHKNFKLIKLEDLEKGSNYQNIRKLAYIYTDINNFVNEQKAVMLEMIGEADNIEDIVCHIKDNANTIEDGLYLSYVKHAIMQLKKIDVNGKFYYEIANAMLQHKSRTEVVNYICTWKYRFMGKKKVLKLISETEKALGVILFGINYLTIPEGLIIERKTKGAGDLC